LENTFGAQLKGKERSFLPLKILGFSKTKVSNPTLHPLLLLLSTF
jgi:hypothetical protein